MVAGAVMGLETTGLYALGIPLFAAVIAFERAIGRRRGEEYFGYAETLSNLSAGLGTLLVGIATGPVVYAAYGFVVENVALISWPEGSLLRWPVALIVSDLCYYVYHRAGHRFGLLWAIHGVHHQHEHLNSTVGLRLEWFADVSTVFFFSPLPLLGIEADCFFPVVALLSLYTLTAHMPALDRPSFGIFVTPAIHGSHHSRDARYIDSNYGAMLTIWDRLFGTLAEPVRGEGLRQDLPSVSRMHDGVSTQWSLLSELFGEVRRAGRAGLWRLWDPPDLQAPQPRAPRDDAGMGRAERIGWLVQLSGTVALASVALWGRERLQGVDLWLCVLLSIGGLRTLGGALDGRPGHVREELVRVALLAMAGLWVSSGLVAALMGIAAASGLLGLAIARAGAPQRGASPSR